MSKQIDMDVNLKSKQIDMDVNLKSKGGNRKPHIRSPP
jgi:hypothetical protein